MSKPPGLFSTPGGRSYAVTFALVSSLFLLWGVCNGMIDVMDKHFQKELHLTLAQSAWVQFAHYLGYFLMAMPAGWLANKFGYKGGIIAGLLLVAIGGFWFIPATTIATFPAFLLGVCVIASGLTFLETVANPYTTVLGPKRFAATRINLAQSCNGIGWIIGPIAGGMFFYGQDETGKSTGSQTLWIPYAVIGCIVLVLAVVFFFSKMPDVKSEDEFQGDEESPAGDIQIAHRGVAMGFLWLNIVVLSVAIGMIFSAVAAIPSVGAKLGITENQALWYASGILLAIGTAIFATGHRKITNRSIWTHPHFSGATLTQFFYVAAQCGIFAYFINYMTSQVPSYPASWQTGRAAKWMETQTTLATEDLRQIPAFAEKLKLKSDAVSTYVYGKLSKETLTALDTYDGKTAGEKELKTTLARDLNEIVKQDDSETKNDEPLYDVQRFTGVSMSKATQDIIKDKEAKRPFNLAKLNRNLLHDAFPEMVTFNNDFLTLSDKGASFLASLGFGFFLAGRFIGSGLLKKFSAHKVLAIFAALAGACSLLVMMKLGWFSAIALFLTYFFMSIMFPTIFSLGIYGLGARAKKASSFIVMAIMGGAIMPKLMGHIADRDGMSAGFIVPFICFIWVCAYGLFWSKLSGSEGVTGTSVAKGH